MSAAAPVSGSRTAYMGHGKPVTRMELWNLSTRCKTLADSDWKSFSREAAQSLRKEIAGIEPDWKKCSAQEKNVVYRIFRLFRITFESGHSLKRNEIREDVSYQIPTTGVTWLPKKEAARSDYTAFSFLGEFSENLTSYAPFLLALPIFAHALGLVLGDEDEPPSTPSTTAATFQPSPRAQK